MPRSGSNLQRVDPYRNYKVRLKWDGRHVAGVSKISTLGRAIEVAEHREDGESPSSRKPPGQRQYEAITLKRGVTRDTEFERWARNASNSRSGPEAELSLEDFRRDLILEVYDLAGGLAIAYKVFRCRVSEFRALPDPDAHSGGAAFERLTLENEGWERHPAVIQPDSGGPAGRRSIEGLAQRIEVVTVWEDLVLPDAQMRVLRDIVAQWQQSHRIGGEWELSRECDRGLGVRVLFVGASGTGKTMAAEALAHELRLDLYRIDLANFVSKYVGETEKHLSHVFDVAERGGAILLFDEADALFGKRAEMKGGPDRYANIEASYLLQRLESYRGLAILTTNTQEAIDPSFTRRLGFVVQFPFPDAEQRAAIWRGIFPPSTPVSGLDHARLAQLAIAGGHIRNIAVAGALLAAERGEPVSMSHLAEAARTEYAKLGRPLSDNEMRGWP